MEGNSMSEAPRVARPVVVRLVLPLIAGAGFLCACDGTDAPSAADRQAEYEGLLASYDRSFVQYLARAQAAMGREVLRYSPISSELAIPKRIDISGSHRDLGSLLGRISQQCGRQPPRVTAARRDFNGQIVEMYRRVYPQYLDLVAGVGDVFGVPPEELDFVGLEDDFFLGLWLGLFDYASFDRLHVVPTGAAPNHNCAVVSARLATAPIVGRNFDNTHERPHFVVYTDMQGAYRVLANAQYAIYHWVMDGINEKGLVMATANNAQPPEYMFTDPYPDVPAIQEHHLFRVALETCATVDEVIALYGSVRPWSQAADHLLVADATGRSAVIEFDLDRRTGVFQATAGYQVLTNIAYHMGFDYMTRNCRRFREATETAEAGIDSLDDLAALMRSIRGPGAGYMSLFDLRARSMRLYLRQDFATAWDFALP
jgi:hypothetical protein